MKHVILLILLFGGVIWKGHQRMHITAEERYMLFSSPQLYCSIVSYIVIYSRFGVANRELRSMSRPTIIICYILSIMSQQSLGDIPNISVSFAIKLDCHIISLNIYEGNLKEAYRENQFYAGCRKT